MTIHGWKVMVNQGLLAHNGKHREAGQKALEKCHDDLYALTKIVSPPRLKHLRTTPIWLEVDTTVSADGKKQPCFHYHPDLEWLIDNDYNPEKLDCVEIGKASTYARQGDRSVRVMLHELAHSYHDRILGFHNKPILKAHKAGKLGGKYPEKIYAMSDFKEYFAEMTVWYFEQEDRRGVARDRDPHGFKLMERIWGPARHYLGDDGTDFQGDCRKAEIVLSQKDESPKFKPTESYTTRDVQGWKVYIDPMLLTVEKEIGQLALDEIDLQLRLVKRALPAFAVEQMQKCAIWLEGENDHHAPAACFHGSAKWLKGAGMNPDKGPGIELSNAARFVRWSKAQPSVLLHELTHFYQFSVLRKDEAVMARLRKGLEAARAGGKYDSVMRHHGRMQRHYAISNVAEYLAESTEAYFGKNDYYPFIRAELMHFDPTAYELMEDIWKAKFREPIDFKRHKNLRVTAVPAEERTRLKLDPFYQKYCSARGFPVVASRNVSSFALKEAAYLINQMLLDRPDIRNALIESKVRFVVIGVNEYTTQMPEYRTMEPRDFWDQRARGLGPGVKRPAVSCGEENLLCYEGDPYSTENILIHEFAHAMHHMGLNRINKSFQKRLDKCFKKATDSDLWVGKYAASNPAEYWAEGVQSWFGTNRQNDHDHNHVNTQAELMEYDRDLAMLVAREYRNSRWQYVYPRDRPEPMHLAGYKPGKAPKFQWPRRLKVVYVDTMIKILERRKAKIDKFEKKSKTTDTEGREALKRLEERIDRVRKELAETAEPEEKAKNKQ